VNFVLSRFATTASKPRSADGSPNDVVKIFHLSPITQPSDAARSFISLMDIVKDCDAHPLPHPGK